MNWQWVVVIILLIAFIVYWEFPHILEGFEVIDSYDVSGNYLAIFRRRIKEDVSYNNLDSPDDYLNLKLNTTEKNDINDKSTNLLAYEDLYQHYDENNVRYIDKKEVVGNNTVDKSTYVFYYKKDRPDACLAITNTNNNYTPLDTAIANYIAKGKLYNTKVEEYNTALEAYNADKSDSNKSAMDTARSTMETARTTVDNEFAKVEVEAKLIACARVRIHLLDKQITTHNDLITFYKNKKTTYESSLTSASKESLIYKDAKGNVLSEHQITTVCIKELKRNIVTEYGAINNLYLEKKRIMELKENSSTFVNDAAYKEIPTKISANKTEALTYTVPSKNDKNWTIIDDEYGTLMGYVDASGNSYDASGNKAVYGPRDVSGATDTGDFVPGTFEDGGASDLYGPIMDAWFGNVRPPPVTADTSISYMPANDFTRLSSADISAPGIAKGFCTGRTPGEIQEMCAKLPKDVCAATSCCVSLGGAKCVAGNENGPTVTSSYNDPGLVNVKRDFYYYNGKCYGNCPTKN